MEQTRTHFTLKAAATVTDQGVFEAVISTVTVDREKDIVEPAALVASLKKWNRPIPLSWNHSTDPEDLIGSVEPMTAREVDREVIVGGQVDLESKKGAEAWRSFKSGTVGFSYGALVPEGGATKRKGGGLHITELDVFEITATPTPMNNDTRVLAVKALEDHVQALEKQVEALEAQTNLIQGQSDKLVASLKAMETSAAEAAPTVDPLEVASRQAVRGIRFDGIPERKSPTKDPDPPPEPPSHADLVERWREVTLQSLRG